MRYHDNRKVPMGTLRMSIADMIALHVRAGDPENPPPELLYQKLPPDAMTLILTIPCDISAVSIQQQQGNYPFFRNAPQVEDGFVIVYARKPDNRYMAIEVLYQGQSFGIDSFREIARRWIEKNRGGFRIQPGRYAYFAPTTEEWGVILRDGGYTALAASAMTFEITRDLLQHRAGYLASGLIVRVPVQTATRSPHNPVAAFAQVELTLDPAPGPESRWISFLDYKRIRAIKSRPPDSLVPLFRNWLKMLAEESGFEFWAFRYGMFFGDAGEWWGARNRRRTLHEGIDFAEGFPFHPESRPIPEGTPVRSLANGEVIAILDDFINKTVVVRHTAITDEDGNVLHTLFSHIQPIPGVLGPVAQGQLLGNIEKAKRVAAPAHLHLTGAWIPASLPSDKISMDQISLAFTPVLLVNFNGLISSGQ